MGAHGHCRALFQARQAKADTKLYNPSSVKTQLKLVFLPFLGQLGCQGSSENKVGVVRRFCEHPRNGNVTHFVCQSISTIFHATWDTYFGL